ncbi:MAG: methyltransferase domain-containing protein [Pirellulales bacterium]
MHLRIYREEDHNDLEVTSVEEESTTEDHLLGQFIPLHYHFNMLQDQHRVGAFAEAIKAVVKPAMHVIELGGGTGILSWLAAQQGARVTCVERNPALVNSARELLAKNHHGERVKVIQEDAFEYVPKEPVDVVICEMLHVGLLREKQVAGIHAFKEHYLEAFGMNAKLPKFLPEATSMLVQPVQFSYDFAGYHAPLPLFQDPAATDRRTVELGELAIYANVFYDEFCPTSFDGAVDLEIIHPGTLTGLRFATQNLIAILVEEQRGIPWTNQLLVLPVKNPVVVQVGDRIHVEFSYQSGGTLESLIESLSINVQFENQFVKKVA